MPAIRLRLLAALAIAGFAAWPEDCAAQSVSASPGFEEGSPAPGGDGNAFGSLLQRVDAAPYRGKRVR